MFSSISNNARTTTRCAEGGKAELHFTSGCLGQRNMELNMALVSGEKKISNNHNSETGTTSIYLFVINKGLERTLMQQFPVQFSFLLPGRWQLAAYSQVQHLWMFSYLKQQIKYFSIRKQIHLGRASSSASFQAR